MLQTRAGKWGLFLIFVAAAFAEGFYALAASAPNPGTSMGLGNIVLVPVAGFAALVGLVAAALLRRRLMRWPQLVAALKALFLVYVLYRNFPALWLEVSETYAWNHQIDDGLLEFANPLGYVAVIGLAALGALEAYLLGRRPGGRTGA